ncbi:MAG: MGMT family protein [Anaerolineae bacterium]|nr:MGMT family protein [Anaerolineae bacterium]
MQPADSLKRAPVYERIYAITRQIPPGKVATYGQIAAMVGSCTARMVGYAMAALPYGSDIPWQRVINRQGKISLRAGGGGSRQRQLLEAEGVHFDPKTESVDFNQVGWSGPDWEWLDYHGFQPGPVWGGMKGEEIN